MQTTLDGKHAVVTGGASGIGLECVRALLDRDASVTVIDRNGDLAESVKKIGADFLCADVADDVAIDDIAESMFSKGDAPAILVTCAGNLQRTLSPEKLSWKEWDRIVRIHQRGTYACCRAFGSYMAKQGSGSIVTIASVSGIRSAPLHAYGPSKAAIIHLTKTLASEWGPSGVRVNCVAPGFTITPSVKRGLEDGTLDSSLVAENTTMGRWIEPSEIAAAVFFLCSPLASAITGITLPVDAGYLVAPDWAVYGGLPRNES